MRGAIKTLALMVLCLAVLYARHASADDPRPSPPKEQPPAAEKADGEKTPATKPDAKKPTAAEAEKKKKEKQPDPFIVPEGTPEELRAFISKVRKTRCTNMLMVLKARRALRRTAEHIIACQPEDKDMSYAVRLKMQLLGNNQERLNEFADELEEIGYHGYARSVRNFGMLIELAKTEKNEPQNRKKAIATVLKFLAEETPTANEARLALTTGRIAESEGDGRYAAEVYMSLAKLFAYCGQEELIVFAQMLAGTSRRLALPNGEIKIEGRIFGGKEELDWSKYKGKVVLVNFWSTWSGPSVADLRKMKKYYDKYHARGFEILGVSCDARPADLESFLKGREIPWPIIYNEDGPSPTVKYYGITELPANILVDRDGKVISLDARGSNLKKELEILFKNPNNKQQPPRIKL